jgi:transposase-like protein
MAKITTKTEKPSRIIYVTNGCGKRFNERTGTPMSRLRTPASIVSFALKMRTEGMGIRASGRVLEKSHTSIMRWEQKLAAQTHQWSPCVPAGGDITIEGLKSILA